MLIITNLTNVPIQQFTLTGVPGIQIPCTLRYMPRIQGWVLDVSYNSFELQGLVVVNSPNILRQWLNIIPFGIACTRTGGLDPYLQNDFLNSTAQLYLLNSDDIAAVEAQYFS